MHSHFTVIYDACVLYPQVLRDILLQLSMTDLFRARWTDRIQQEWAEAIKRSRPELDPARIDRTCDIIRTAFPECYVTGHEPLIDTLHLPDPDDRHVLAAAIHANAQVIVTTNLRHFPDAALQPHRITAQHPDQFIFHLFDLDPAAATEALRLVRQRMKRPPYEPFMFADLLEHLGLPRTAAQLRARNRSHPHP